MAPGESKRKLVRFFFWVGVRGGGDMTYLCPMCCEEQQKTQFRNIDVDTFFLAIVYTAL